MHKKIYLVVMILVCVVMLTDNVEARTSSWKIADVIQKAGVVSWQPQMVFEYSSAAIIAEYENGGGDLCALIEFDHNIMSARNTDVRSAFLKFKVAKITGQTEGRELVFYPLKSGWDESSVNWDSKPQRDARHKASRPLQAGDGWQLVDMTKIVQDWANNRIENHGVIVCNYQMSDDVAMEKSALKIPFDQENKPRLHVESYRQLLATPRGDVVIVNNQAADNGEEAQVNNENVENDEVNENDRGALNNEIDGADALGEIIALSSPGNESLIETSTPTFKWKYLQELLENPNVVLVLQKEGGVFWNKSLDKNTTMYSWPEQLEDGKYIWFIKLTQNNIVIQQTPTRSFRIQKLIQGNDAVIASNAVKDDEGIVNLSDFDIDDNELEQDEKDENKIEKLSTQSKLLMNNFTMTSKILLAIIIVLCVIILLIISFLLGRNLNNPNKKSNIEDAAEDKNKDKSKIKPKVKNKK